MSAGSATPDTRGAVDLSRLADDGAIHLDPATCWATAAAPPVTHADVAATIRRLSAPRYLVAYPAGELPVPGRNMRLFELVGGTYREIGGNHVVE